MSGLAVIIEGRIARTLAVSAVGAQTAGLEAGIYDVWCDVDVFIRVDDATNTAPNRPQDVTAANGYKIFAGNVVPVQVANNRAIGAIAAGAGTLSYHRVA